MVGTWTHWEVPVPVAVSLSQFILAAVFAVAGTAKLLDRAGTRRAVASFGVPAPLRAPLAIAVPVAELTIAAALLFPPLARWAALAAAALLLVFCAAIVSALARGSAPDCNCFGGLAQTEVGRGTLVRNLVLGALAVVAALGSDRPAGALDWIGRAAEDRGPATVVIGVLVAGILALGLLCWALLRQNGRLLLQMEAQASELAAGPAAAEPAPLAAGDLAPEFAAATVGGEAVSLATLTDPGLPVALVFADTGCGACERVLARAARSERDRVTVGVVMRGDGARARERAVALGLPLVIHDPHDALFEAFRVRGAPGTLLLDCDGRVVGPLRIGSDAAHDALAAAAGDAAPVLDVAVVGA